MRPSRKLIGWLVAPLVVVAACSGGDSEPVEIGQAGTRPTETTGATTTTSEVLTTTTLAPAIVEIPPVPEWGEGWTGPTLELGDIRLQAFNDFVLENAPDGVSPDEAVSVYLKPDPADPNIQMLSGDSGGPEATEVSVIINVQDDDSVRAFRYEFVLERRSRDFAQVSDEEGEEAEEGDTAQADDELDSNEGDAATEEDIDIEEGLDGIPWMLSGRVTVQCQPSRGHQDFSVQPCV